MKEESSHNTSNTNWCCQRSMPKWVTDKLLKPCLYWNCELYFILLLLLSSPERLDQSYQICRSFCMQSLSFTCIWSVEKSIWSFLFSFQHSMEHAYETVECAYEIISDATLPPQFADSGTISFYQWTKWLLPHSQWKSFNSIPRIFHSLDASVWPSVSFCLLCCVWGCHLCHLYHFHCHSLCFIPCFTPSCPICLSTS